MSSPSPPKPWETSGGATSASVGLTGSNSSTTPSATSTMSSNAPPLPSVPDSLSTVANRNATNYSSMNNRYGSPYSTGYGGMNSYSSPYSSMGGGYGSMYGVGAFGGFAQMLQSTYMATHSSFFAMVSVAEQFGNLRQTLGSVLGIYTVMRWIRTAIAKLTGRPLPADATALTPASFAAFNGRMPDGSPAPAKPSKKPFIVFMLAVFGLPYLMGKLIKALARSQEAEEQRKMLENPQAGQPLDPNKLEFCRALYDFTPNANMQGMDLSVKKGDMVAVLSKSDPMGNASEWWKCRSRDGRMGYLPGIYLETIQRKTPAQITNGSPSGSLAGSRTQTMTSSSAPNRTATMVESKVSDKVGPKVESKAGDMGVESFQKGAFYS
ncbi:Peroxin-13-N multi-domain protein [Pyrenophora tritici-repentis]|nr:Peroxin-13-N multi-domain protein [Pyrenophora tritici-repentis]PZD03860.1 Peroxin-13-N multi-domain protein [Pyrenophora tritici-repentis]PZD28458.1 Peroxin-13-N multi-domain protein [Pyrenophora tritici-repentis]PZD46842.1 Peroxin-13-N multi-domain protein [Pyrenophora tritici-repentis]